MSESVVVKNLGIQKDILKHQEEKGKVFPEKITIYIKPFGLNYPLRDAISKLMEENGYEETGSGCLLAEDKYDISFKKR